MFNIFIFKQYQYTFYYKNDLRLKNTRDPNIYKNWQKCLFGYIDI